MSDHDDKCEFQPSQFMNEESCQCYERFLESRVEELLAYLKAERERVEELELENKELVGVNCYEYGRAETAEAKLEGARAILLDYLHRQEAKELDKALLGQTK